MSEKCKLLEYLSAAEFACYETRLYLDTHPGDPDALAAACEYEERAAKLRAEYEQTWGSLTGKACSEESCGCWVNDPWPWNYDFA